MLKQYLILLLSISHLICAKPQAQFMLFSTKDIAQNTKEITITFIVPEKDFIYKDFITCSSQEPMVRLSPWKADKESVSHYDPSFKEAKQVFNETFSITMIATSLQWISEPIHFYCSYYRKTDKKINDALFLFSFPQQLETNINLDGTIEPSSSIDGNTSRHMHHRSLFFEHYYAKISNFSHQIIAVLIHHRTTCLSLLLITMSLLFLLFYMHQENLKQYTKLYELLEMIISILMFIIISYGIWHLYCMNKPLSTLPATSIAVIFLIITGIFYIKKSTNVSLGILRTFYTCIGMICIIFMILLIFKTIQYADQHMNLFQRII